MTQIKDNTTHDDQKGISIRHKQTNMMSVAATHLSSLT